MKRCLIISDKFISKDSISEKLHCDIEVCTEYLQDYSDYMLLVFDKGMEYTNVRNDEDVITPYINVFNKDIPFDVITNMLNHGMVDFIFRPYSTASLSSKINRYVLSI